MGHYTGLEEGVTDGKTQIRAERRQLYTATCNVVKNMTTNVFLPYVVISAGRGFENTQQYDFVVSRNPSDGGILRVLKAIFHNIT